MNPIQQSPEIVPMPATTGIETVPVPVASVGERSPVETPASSPTGVGPTSNAGSAASLPAVPLAVGTTSPMAPAVVLPGLAEDVDVIEKEWVDAAENIIVATAGDPHAQEEQQEVLQIDYLKKRYGKDIGPAGEA
jgi:hypothetical protein